MTERKRIITFLRNISVFVVLGLLFFTAIVFIFTTYPNLISKSNLKNTTGGYGASLSRARDANKFDTVDVLFLGSSHCYRGFDTRIFQQNDCVSFNLGSSSQSPLNSYFLLKRVLSKIASKKSNS